MADGQQDGQTDGWIMKTVYPTTDKVCGGIIQVKYCYKALYELN